MISYSDQDRAKVAGGSWMPSIGLFFSVPISPGKLVISYSDQDRAKVAGVAANHENDTCFEADL